MRTTLTLDEDIAAKLKAEVRKSGRPFRELVNEFLRTALNTRRRQAPAKPFCIRPRGLGIRPGMDYDNIGELIEQIEGPAAH